jgi:hypothetical protein
MTNIKFIQDENGVKQAYEYLVQLNMEANDDIQLSKMLA